MFLRCNEQRGLILGDGQPAAGAAGLSIGGESQISLRPAGMTLLELMIAMTVMVMVIGTLGALSKGVQEGFRYTEGHGLATQHARVVLDRIGEAVREATVNEQFPGAIVLAETVGSWRFPDTLVVWRPDGDPVDANGLPRYNELVIYCPHWAQPNQLVEITAPNDMRTVPLVQNQAQWAAEIGAIKRSDSSRVVTLTELIRTGSAADAMTTSLRGTVRFETRLRPSQSEWDDYQDGTLAWDALSWVQGIYGSQTGLRQVWLRTELLLTAGETANAAGGQYVPFFGSAALYCEMHK